MTRGGLARALAGGLLLLAPRAAAQAPGPSPSPRAATAEGPGAVPAEGPAAVATRLEAAWKARDTAAYLALWDFGQPEDEQQERQFAAVHFSAQETQLAVQRVGRVRGEEGRGQVSVRIFTVNEPRARVEQWAFAVERRDDGWVVVERESHGQIDGLVHLSLSPEGYRAAGLSLRLEDFELTMTRGTLYTSPPELGPTVLVFAGEGIVRFRPRLPTEAAQLAIFSGRPELAEKVRLAFVRLHPADLHHVLAGGGLEPDPQAGARFPEAERFYREHVNRSFLLDAPLPRSPWWVLPSLGDAAVTFPTRRLGTLTFTVNGSEPEGISLFDRARRRQICLYPQAGRDTRYNEDAARAVDVVAHDLRVSFEPSRPALSATDTLRLNLLAPATTLRLKLSEDFRVESITSAEAGTHLFFRIRGQDAIMVSMGALSGRIGEVTLTVRYSGTHAPSPIDREVVQLGPPPPDTDTVVIENVLVYTNRTSWYPQAGGDDHATASLRFDVPVGFTAVTGGERTLARVEGNRTHVEYRQDRPGKYISVAVGRLVEAGTRADGPVALRGFALPRTRRLGEELLARASEILAYYAEEFGPCPFPSLNLVAIEGFTPGGHSPPGMIVVQQRPALLRGTLVDDPANFSDVPGFFLAHELAHQWWGHGVAGQNYHERWLSEAFAQYAAALWVRRAHGEDTLQSMLRRMGRWALRTSHQGPIHLGYRLGHIKGEPQVYRAIVYNKGAYVLHMLRGIVGEDAFRRGLTAFQERHRFRKAGTQDLREALEAASGRELGSYFEEWVYGTELPALSYSHHHERHDGQHRTVVVVNAHGLPGPVPLHVAVRYEGGVEERVLTIPPTGGRYTVETPGAPRKVEVNSDRGLLATVTGG